MRASTLGASMTGEWESRDGGVGVSHRPRSRASRGRWCARSPSSSGGPRLLTRPSASSSGKQGCKPWLRRGASTTIRPASIPWRTTPCGSAGTRWRPLGARATRDAFKAAVAERMPQIDDASTPNQAGTVYRFVHAMKVGDIVVCPDRRTGTLNIGRVSGPYEFHPESDVHKQWRPVEWIRTGVPRNELSYP